MTNGQTRRTALGAMAAGVGMAGVGLMAMTDQTTAQAQTGGKTFVLVHGAWHGGWCWRRVSDLLEKQGPQGVRADDDGARRALAPDRRQDRSRDPRHRHRQRDQMGEPQRHRAGRPLLWRRRSSPASPSRCATRSARSCSSMRSCRRTATAWRPRPRSPCAKRSRRLVEKGETAMKPVPAAVFRVNEKDRAWVDAMCTPHPVGDAHRQDHVDRRARAHRQEGLYPRQGLSERAVRRLLRQAQDRQRMARLRAALRPRRHGRHARPAHGDSARGGVATGTRRRTRTDIDMRSGSRVSRSLPSGRAQRGPGGSPGTRA